MNNQPYSSDPRMNEYQDPTEHIPYQGQPYQGQPYQEQPYQGQPYQEQPYQGQPYQGQPYQGQPYQGQSYQGQPYQGQSYGNAVNNVPNESMYEQRQYQNYSNGPAGQTERPKISVSLTGNSMNRASVRNWFATLIYFLLGVLEVILALRFIFRLLGANQNSGFIQFLYTLSGGFVGPFNGIFNDQTIGNTSVFEVSTLIAILVYALVGWGLVSLVRVILASNSSGR